MALVLALPKLFEDVVATFAAAAGPATPVPQVFGWRERAKHPTGPNAGMARRIVWVPGDDSNGNVGELGSAREPGRLPRPLATLHELVTVYLEAADLSSPSAAENELAQYAAARTLFNTWYAAVYGAARGTFGIVGTSWVVTQNERRHGAALRVLLAIDAMVPDETTAEAVTDLVGATWALSELDHTENGSAEPGPI